MDRNSDFTQRAVVHAASEDWVASPMPGVDRRILDRIGDEVARATSIVRYAPGSAFSPHIHTGGEEFLVLEGVFSDEHGDFPEGSYIRNPPDSSHTPGSEPGCTILVKLWQFDLADRTHVRVDTNKMRFLPDRDAVEIAPLFSDGREDVAIERWAPDATVSLDAPNGLELLVLDGGFVEGDETFERLSWLRLPKGASSSAEVGPTGARVWIKRDHLRETPVGPKA
ncbi:ChrR Cupin-like domain protein [Roseovarius sp. THAF27]|uniref:cupin domain-containing protein n=1 Tax=Roseovarius sp. THAF27 TaxID=2587850 RepID=UPI001267A022|nr:cupin domain-containing protein [Roseovarius sp. THAF27]QFT81832.1 ChrR Cupin-like domain protein [Roseovarius sp. THAF27]